MHKNQTLIYRLSLFATGLAVIVVVLGAFTRLVDAGLGCPDWPGCYGHIMWPDEEHEIIKAEAAFPDAPVELDKTWPEMVHRYFASTLGLVIFFMLVMCRRKQTEDLRLPMKMPLFLSALVILQGAFGMWTVTLKLWPQVVTAHLLGGFATLSFLWLMVQRTGGRYWRAPPAILPQLLGLKKLAVATLVVVVVQIALGGWTTSNYAALACPDLPTCHGVFWPEADYKHGFNIFQHVGPNYLGGLLDNHARTAIHMAHRLGAIAVLIITLILAVKLWRINFEPARRFSVIIAAALTLQIALGLSNVFWALPLAVAVAHNAFGALLLLVMVTVNHRLRTLSAE